MSEYAKREAINRLQDRATALETLTAAMSTAELGFLDGVTAGTGLASKALVLNSSGNVIMPSAGLFGLSRGTLAAAGSGASDAAIITQQVTAVTGSNGTLAVALPAAAVTTGPLLVINTVLTTGATLPVFPVNGGNDNINGGAEDAAFTMGPGKAAWFIPTSATQWYVADVSGATCTKEELDILTGVTASAAELNILTGATPVVAEVNSLTNQPASLTTVSTTPASGSCAVQLVVKDSAGSALNHAVSGIGYSSTVNGLDVAAVTSFATLTNGIIDPITTTKVFHFITSATGTLGCTLTASAGTYYITLQLPNGKLVTSSAIVVNS